MNLRTRHYCIILTFTFIHLVTLVISGHMNNSSGTQYVAPTYDFKSQSQFVGVFVNSFLHYKFLPVTTTNSLSFILILLACA